MKGSSPILAVLLMVILTVVLSTVFYSVSSHLIQKVERAPITVLDAQFYKDAVIVKHIGGDPFNIRFAKLTVTTHSGTYAIPFLENYVSRDVELEIGDAKAVMLKECDCFDSYGRDAIFWKGKEIGEIAKSVVNKW